MTTSAPPTDLRSTTRARYAPGRHRRGNARVRAAVGRRPGAGRRPARDDLAQAGSETDEVERLLVRLVRDPEAAAGVDELDGRAGAPARDVAQLGPSRRRARRGGRVEDVRGAERVEAEQLEMGRRRRPCAALAARSARVHPELAGAVVTDEPDALEPGVLGDRGAQQDRLADARPGARSPRAVRARRATRP